MPAESGTVSDYRLASNSHLMAQADVALLRRQPLFMRKILAEIQEQGCYFKDLSDHGQGSVEEVNDVRVIHALMNEDDGTFLVRNKLSTRHDGFLSLSVKFLVPGADSDVWHLNIACSSDKVYLSHDSSLRFDSFAALVRYYKRHSIPVVGASRIYLRRCLSAVRPEVEPPRRPPKPRPRAVPRDGQLLSPRQASVALQHHLSRLHSIDGHHRDPCPLPASAEADDRSEQPLQLPKGRGAGRDGGEEGCDSLPLCCDCGVSFEDARLPSGWTMHLSHEPETRGFPFFKDPSGVATWTLPPSVIDQMSEIEERLLARRVAASASGQAAKLHLH